MLGNTKRRTVKLVFGLFVAVTLVGAVGVATAAAAGGPQGRGNGQTLDVEAAPLSDLTDAEVDGILFMREEEKLARDVYQTLFEIWGQPVFENIARSEQAHMDALKTLIDRYGLEDPVAGNEVGVFTDATLQEMYDDLVAQGSESLESALRVGAAIEEIDILDLEEYIADTDAADVVRVYENLLRGSRNHLRAFVRTLEQQAGETYEPQHMSEASYGEVIAEQVQTGRGLAGSGRGVRDGAVDGRGRGGRRANGTGANQTGAGGRGAGRGSAGVAGLGDGECLQ